MIATRVTLSAETVIATVRRTEGGLAVIHTAHQVCPELHPVRVLQHTICTCAKYTVYVETFALLNFPEWRILKKFAFLFSRVELNNIHPQHVNKHFRELNFRKCLVIHEICESLNVYGMGINTYSIIYV